MESIYQVKCLVTERSYFGRSVEVPKRWRAHLNMLRRGVHYNTEMQADFSAHGEESFTFEVLEIVTPGEEAVAREQYYLDTYKVISYNIKDARHGGDTYTGNPRKEEISALKSKIFSGKGNPMYGKPKSDYTLQRIKEVNSKKVRVEGVVYASLTEASKALNIGITTISYRLRSKTFKDWEYVSEEMPND